MRIHRGGSKFQLESLERRALLAAAVQNVIVANDELTFQNVLPPQHTLVSTGTQAQPAALGQSTPLTAGLNFLKSHAVDLGLSTADVANPIVTDQYTDDLTGVTHIYLQQQFNGLPVLDATYTVNVLRNGRVLSIAGGFVPGLGYSAKTTPATTLAPGTALSIAGRQLGLSNRLAIRAPAKLSGRADRLTQLSAPALSLDSIPAKLVYVPVASGGVELAWEMILRTPDNQHWYDVAVGTSSSAVVMASDWADSADFNVIPRPIESPQDGQTPPNRTILTDVADPVASPYGWNDTNGIAGPEFTDTRGNNVIAQEDTDGNNSGGFRPDGGPNLDFNFPLDLSQPPIAYQSAAIANMFYWTNLLHDIHYKYGFTEVAGNFQANNYGRGGVDDDALYADAQDGTDYNNANFFAGPDGTNPRMQMYLWDKTTPLRDGDLDNEIIIHEYGHGVSKRLTGGPTNANGLNAVQSQGMSEGWSDWWALMFTQDSFDGKYDAYPMAAYVMGHANNGAGIRRKPYSFDMAIDPLTIAAYGSGGGIVDGVTKSTEAHNVGEIWCSALWDMACLLVDRYGFDPNIQNGFNPADIKGNTLALRLVMDGLKLQPSDPSFKDARDAILLADDVLNGDGVGTPGSGKDRLAIWQAFARRGMGHSFVDTASTATSVTPAYDLPTTDPFILSATPTGRSVSPISSVTVTFDQAMDSGSFDPAVDVASFTGPGSVDLRSTISGHQWLSTTQLKINFTATSAYGAYEMTLGPGILAVDDGHAMDQTGNAVAGESGDVFTFGFVFATTVGPDLSGYQAALYPVQQGLDLQIGQSGVVDLFDGSDDGSGFIDLGANTFNFYGTTYTGSAQIAVSTNGLITFVATNISNGNGDLLSSPAQAAIAVLWDDWRTDVDASVVTNSAVLYKLDDTNGDTIPDQLIVEWSDIINRSTFYGTATFQAILQLNTGATPGRIILNYPDITISNASFSDGASATVGIKNSGPQGGNRLLVSQDSNAHPWVQSGSAIVIAMDVVAPTVVSSSFNYTTAQQFVVTFNENVWPGLSVADLLLTNTTTSQTIPAANLSVSYNSNTNTATFTALSLLPDGNYTAQLISSGVTDPPGNPLDGDADQIIGGDFMTSFFVLGGDADHDRVVDISDLHALANNFKQPGAMTFNQGDFNYDGTVDNADLAILAANWQVNLAPPPPSLAASLVASPARRRPTRTVDLVT